MEPSVDPAPQGERVIMVLDIPTFAPVGLFEPEADVEALVTAIVDSALANNSNDYGAYISDVHDYMFDRQIEHLMESPGPRDLEEPYIDDITGEIVNGDLIDYNATYAEGVEHAASELHGPISRELEAAVGGDLTKRYVTACHFKPDSNVVIVVLGEYFDLPQ